MKFIAWTCGIVLALATLLLGFAWYSGAWNLLLPSGGYDIEPPELPAELPEPSVLVFSKTNGFRHKDGIIGGRYVLRGIALKQRWGFFATENGAIFNPADLARFRAVVFLNATGDMLSAEQRTAFRTWLEQGGGWLGIHAAGDGSHAQWPWYVDNLIGARFTAHIMGPQFQRAEVITENHGHPVNANMENIWEHVEEWYSWDRSPRASGMLVLATVNEDSYQPVQKLLGRERDLAMTDHPITWSNCIAAGRSVYTAIGHRAEAFAVPQVEQLLGNALRWLVSPGGDESHCPKR